TVQSIQDAFIASPHHYENLVDPVYNYVGIGVVDSGGKIYVTVDFMQLNGASAAPAPAPAPRVSRPRTTTAPRPAPAPQPAPVARTLEAAERRQRVEGTAVDLDLTAADAAGDGLRPVGIAGPHAGREAVVGVVGDAHGVLFVLVRNDRQHGPEDLLLGDRHV